jgi:hypothetical protein
MNELVPTVTDVEVLHDFVVRLSFDDGSVGDLDLVAHLWGPVFQPLRDDPQLFRQVRVDPEARTIVWPNGADLAPETLYREAMAPRAV